MPFLVLSGVMSAVLVYATAKLQTDAKFPRV